LTGIIEEQPGYGIVASEMRTLLDRLETESTSPTLAEVLTPEGAGKVLGAIIRGMEIGFDPFLEPRDSDPSNIQTVMYALYELARQGKKKGGKSNVSN
jgi:hypothetical protein